jgi:hypothetical protein
MAWPSSLLLSHISQLTMETITIDIVYLDILTDLQILCPLNMNVWTAFPPRFCLNGWVDFTHIQYKGKVVPVLN